MANLSSIVETAHRDVVHDAEMNFYGTKLATCASDHIIKVFDVKTTGQTHQMAELTGHEGPVWQVRWSAPFKDRGELLASCSHDKKVFIWRENNNKYNRIYEFTDSEASVNSISWAPEAYGSILACCSTDCSIAILTAHENIWDPFRIFNAHEQGVNAVSWAPAKSSRSIFNLEEKLLPQRIVSGGNDKLVKIWRKEAEKNWICEVTLEGHLDWVRDVAWSPVETHNNFTIASCGIDGQVFIWRTDNMDGKIWKKYLLTRSEEPIFNVSWSPNGTVLAVSFSDNRVALFQERIQNEWVQISDPCSEN